MRALCQVIRTRGQVRIHAPERSFRVDEAHERVEVGRLDGTRDEDGGRARLAAVAV